MSSSFSRKAVLDIRTHSWFDGVTKIVTENGVSLNVQNFRSMVARLKTASAGGTSPTLDVKWQTQMPNDDWVDIPGVVFTQATTNGEEVIFNIDDTGNFQIPLGQRIRPVLTIGGTTPTFDVTLDAVLKS